MTLIKQSTNPSKRYMIKVNYIMVKVKLFILVVKIITIILFIIKKKERKKPMRERDYINRHKKDNLNDPFSPGFWSMNLLWREPTIQESLKKILSKYPSIKLENI